jgi:8-amino-7-oxononanoate synthase
VIIGDEATTLELSQRLRAAGHYAPAIRPPTVPAATCRLRLSPSLSHTEADIRRLVQAMSAQR